MVYYYAIMARRTEGTRLLKACVTPKFTQEQIAEALDVSQQAVSAWVNGKAAPSRDYAAKLEDLLGIPMRTWTEDPQDDDAPESGHGTGNGEPTEGAA